MKIIDWLMQLPEPYSTQAIENCRSFDADRLQRDEDNMSGAINASMHWERTPQGHPYWKEIYDKYHNYEEGGMTEEDLKQFESFVKSLEERRAKLVVFSASMRQMLQEIGEHNYVAKYMLSNSDNTLFGNYVTMRGEMCSFLPKGKPHMVNDEGTWRREGRQEMKPAKLARKILPDEYTEALSEKDFETFNNMVRSYIGINGDEDGEGRTVQLEVVSGKDIRKYYYEENYSKLADSSSNLWGSCMRYESCQDYFDIFVENNVKMLIAKDVFGKVVGRALLWECTNGRKAMDTIYTPERLRPMFIKWAIDNEHYYKSQQSCHHHEFDMFAGSPCDDWEATIQLDDSDFSEYPYMDTFMYLNDDNHTLSNREGCHKLVLRDTSGGFERCGVVYDDLDDTDIDEDYAVYISYHTGSVSWSGTTHIDNTVMTRYSGRILERDSIEVDGHYYAEGDENIVYVDSRNEYYHVDDTVVTEDGDTIHEDDARECAFDGCTYHEDDMTKHEDVWVHNDNMELYLEELNQEENV
jgi:hypothetical protein